MAEIREGRLGPDDAEQSGSHQGVRWEAAYAPRSRAEVPDVLRTALEAAPDAAAFFATQTGADRYAAIFRFNEAKTAMTRAERIAKFVAMLAQGETLHPSSRRRADIERVDRRFRSN